ncbi:hypothetical protein FA95DRAFT_1457107, partial [Auriscalpium vulgare]
MCLAMQEYDIPFGGKNMVFAGDFAQLPPPSTSPALYFRTADTTLHTTHSHKVQKAAMGKAIWHQTPVCVILRENMRQKTQSVEDGKFRTALENMRYKSCTSEDIALLRTRIAGRKPDQPHINDPQFRYVSVITGLNSHRDRLNEINSKQFALDHGRRIHKFYSVDKWKGPSTEKPEGKHIRKRKNVIDPLRSKNSIAMSAQQTLWNLPHAITQNHPGILSLCKGMHVMIKKNEATEVGVTNGAEGVVTGWKAYDIGHNRQALDTLFVRLTTPTRPINLSGLDANVVPVSHQTQDLTCEMPDDSAWHISRQQVPVIPNYAMTDFASQGRTRQFNVVDLHNCRTQQSYYTALSRGSSLQGTLIVQGFFPQRIQGGLSGWLRQ